MNKDNVIQGKFGSERTQAGLVVPVGMAQSAKVIEVWSQEDMRNMSLAAGFYLSKDLGTIPVCNRCATVLKPRQDEGMIVAECLCTVRQWPELVGVEGV